MPFSASILARPGTVLLDTARPDAENRASLLFTDPERLLTAETPAEVPGLLRAMDRAVADGFYVAGYLAYEAGYAFEHVADAAPVAGPLAWFGVYRAPDVLTAGDVAALLAGAGEAYAIDAPAFDVEQTDYLERIAAIRRLIREGDVYQVNFTGRVRFGFGGSPAAFYAALRRAQRVAYGAFVHAGSHQVLSASPELFFRREGRRIVARPMKGTVRRGHTPGEDETLQTWLRADPKSRAENLMIVDLLRNDLSRCCRPGSVRVPALFDVEPYETLHQMTTTIEGELQDGIGYEALFRALFPCGSVTGAPKLRAMQRIHALEAGPRGVYCGAIGYAGPGERATFNVAIRTVRLEDGRGEMGVGSGIVWDSDAASEYEECLLKARFLTDRGRAAGHVAPAATREAGFELIETMVWDGGIDLLDRHVARMRASAACFGFPYDEAALRAAVAGATRGLAAGSRTRVRATLDASGRFAVTTAPIGPPPAQPVRLALAAEPVSSVDPFRYHKTTRRELLEAAYQRARDEGFDEVLFVNERGEVTEGSRSNVFAEIDGRLLTPPRTSGLLAGVYRQHVLETWPRAAERVLTPDDLRSADAVYVSNAVWGLRRAQFEAVPVDFG